MFTPEGLANKIHSPGELEDEDHSSDKSLSPKRLFPKRFAVFNGNGE